MRQNIRKFVYSEISKGRKIAGYGAAAKGNTFLNFCGFTETEISYLVDKNPEKIGKVAPGSGIKIFEERYLSVDKPDFILILPWNLKREIVSQLSYVKSWGCKFICASPDLVIF